MHVTIVGAGALGRVYGVRLAGAGATVSFVVRPARLGESSPIVIEQVNGPHRRDAIERPDRVAEVPRASSIVMVAVRFDQIGGEEVAARLREAPKVPIVLLTPTLPRQRAALERALGRRITPAMPGLAGYLDDRGVVRYWVTKVAATLLDDAAGKASAEGAALEDLARRLDKAGLPVHFQKDVAALNVATTIAFFPLVAAIDAGGGVDGALGDKDLVATVIEAARESEALGKKLGKVASWAHLLTRFVGPYTLKPGVALARGVAPETVKFVDAHFGAKLHTQHLAMGEAILALGEDLGHEMAALKRLMEMLRARAA
jgi:2-dehydropantoate 2-reductase